MPGLAAKPVIDVALTVRDSADEDRYVPALTAAGFRFHVRESEHHQHRVCYRRIDFGHDRDVNLHVYTAGCMEFDRYLVFRDRLRADEDDRLPYQRTKQDLAEWEWKYVQDYADAKTTVIQQIRDRAGDVGSACLLC